MYLEELKLVKIFFLNVSEVFLELDKELCFLFYKKMIYAVNVGEEDLNVFNEYVKKVKDYVKV